MKYLLLTTGLAIILAAQPVQAEDAAKSQDANTAETLHAPTNRVGDMVPTMTAPSNKDDAAASESTSGENSAKAIHPPTNRVGDEVPTMKSAENKDERTSKTTDGSASSN